MPLPPPSCLLLLLHLHLHILSITLFPSLRLPVGFELSAIRGIVSNILGFVYLSRGWERSSWVEAGMMKKMVCRRHSSSWYLSAAGPRKPPGCHWKSNLSQLYPSTEVVAVSVSANTNQKIQPFINQMWGQAHCYWIKVQSWHRQGRTCPVRTKWRVNEDQCSALENLQNAAHWFSVNFSLRLKSEAMYLDVQASLAPSPVSWLVTLSDFHSVGVSLDCYRAFVDHGMSYIFGKL